ncbi:MAG TPA: nodulation protein NfeD [Steroidobacteraceae bacterium]
MRLKAVIAFLGLLAGITLLASAAEDSASSASAAPGTGPVTVLEIEGPIGPATSRYIEKGLLAAQQKGSRLIVIQMDTPGGLDTSMRDIIQAILASQVPVATYVAPNGARAASAGAYILIASHIAAMAPATNVGAATPVSIGGEPQPAPGSRPRQEDDKSKPEDEKASPSAEEKKKEKEEAPIGEPATAMERKVINDAVAYIRSLAELRGRNMDWAERAVRRAESISATDALAQNVIDVVASDLTDLLNQIDGREVKVGNKTVTLATRNAEIERVTPDWRTRLLQVITNPTIAYGLLLIGIYGLLLEGYNPGAIVPGVVGAIALLLALFAFQILSVNYAGLALVALGIAMIVLEFFVPSYGALGLGGLIAFVVGSIILLDTDVPGMDIGLPIVTGVATAGGLAVIGIAYMATRSMHRPVVTGVNAMIGATAEALEDFSERGMVRYGGELWSAKTSAPVRKGQTVRIVKVEGLLLWVEPL